MNFLQIILLDECISFCDEDIISTFSNNSLKNWGLIVSKIKIDNHCTDKGVKGPGGTACGHQDTHVTFVLNWNPLDLMSESNLGPFWMNFCATDSVSSCNKYV